MTQTERLAMYIACCQCCLLAQAMKDCPLCLFNVGLEQPIPVELPKVEVMQS